MDTRLIHGGMVVEGYLFVGKVSWGAASSEPDIFGEGEYLHGERVGIVLAVRGDARPDVHGYFPCVFLRVRRNWTVGDAHVTLDYEKDIEVVEEVCVNGISGSGVALIHNPRAKHELYVVGTLNDQTRMKIADFAERHGLMLLKNEDETKKEAVR